MIKILELIEFKDVVHNINASQITNVKGAIRKKRKWHWNKKFRVESKLGKNWNKKMRKNVIYNKDKNLSDLQFINHYKTIL